MLALLVLVLCNAEAASGRHQIVKNGKCTNTDWGEWTEKLQNKQTGYGGNMVDGYCKDFGLRLCNTEGWENGHCTSNKKYEAFKCGNKASDLCKKWCEWCNPGDLVGDGVGQEWCCRRCHQ